MRQQNKPPAKSKSERGLPVVLGFLCAMGIFFCSGSMLLHRGIKWPLKYPEKGELAWPAASVLLLGATLVFVHGFYFLFVLPPNAGPERPRNFFRVINWLGILMILGAGFIPDTIADGWFAKAAAH